MTYMTLPAATVGRPTRDILVRREWNRGELWAIRLGHVVSKPEWDTEDSVVGFCVRCEGLLAADATEAPYVFGPILGEICPNSVDIADALN